MLAKANRIVRGADYRTTVRRGVRISARTTVVYIRQSSRTTVTGESGPVRFGFIVSKQVGTAVQRNRVRRRLKAVCYGLLPQLSPGNDIVIRALPASVQAPWTTLQEEITRAVDKVGVR